MLAGLVIYLVLAILMVVLQSRMVYYPSREIGMTPDKIGLAFEDVSIDTDDGIRLSGWFIPHESGENVILFCHGNAGNISHRLDSIRIFHELGLSTFIFDYRGYGRSTGKPSERGTGKDTEAAWRYLVEERGIDPERIIIFGRSLGGAIAAQLAMKHTPKAFILESSFTSVADIGAQLYPWLPVRLLSRFDYPTIAFVKDIACPVLVVHSSGDDLIPFNHGRELFEAAPEPKEFLEIRGSHNEGFLVTGQPYKDGLRSFLTRYVNEAR